MTRRYCGRVGAAFVAADGRVARVRGEVARGRVVTRVLLVTGARSLADDPAAEAWARGLIAEALAGVGLLIVGDAPGPDAWASRIQRNAMRRVWCYRTRGPNARWIDTAHCEEWDRLRLWSTGVSAHPLDRNAAMVDAAAAMRDAGVDVRVLALLDGRKPRVVQPGEDRPTRGTEHTVGLAEDAGLTVDARVWPKGATT